MALQDHLVNYFHFTEYHPGVLEGGTGVTCMSYFLPEKKCVHSKGPGRSMSLRLLAGPGSDGIGHI